jgi:hypothetical protein
LSTASIVALTGAFVGTRTTTTVSTPDDQDENPAGCKCKVTDASVGWKDGTALTLSKSIITGQLSAKGTVSVEKASEEKLVAAWEPVDASTFAVIETITANPKDSKRVREFEIPKDAVVAAIAKPTEQSCEEGTKAFKSEGEVSVDLAKFRPDPLLDLADRVGRQENVRLKIIVKVRGTFRCEKCTPSYRMSNEIIVTLYISWNEDSGYAIQADFYKPRLKR